MADKKQTIQEALAAVQRKVNEQREAYARSLYEAGEWTEVQKLAKGAGAGISRRAARAAEAEKKAKAAVNPTTTTPSTAPSNSISGSQPIQSTTISKPISTNIAEPISQTISKPVGSVSINRNPSVGTIGSGIRSKLPTMAQGIGGAALGGAAIIGGAAVLNKNQSPTASASPAPQTATPPSYPGQKPGEAFKEPTQFTPPAPQTATPPSYPGQKPGEAFKEPTQFTPPDKTPLPPPRPTTKAPAQKAPAPKPQAAPEVDTAAIYKKHGVGSPDEDNGAFHRAEAEIARAKGGRAPNDFADTFSKPSASARPARPSETPRPNSTPEKTGGSSKGGNMDMSDIFKGDDTPKTQTASNSPTNSPGSYFDKTMAGRQSSNVEDRRKQSQIDNVEAAESGPSRGKKKMSESALINAFMKLQQTKAGNIFEAAKKMKTRYEGGKDDEDKTSWTDDEVKHNNSPEGLDTYAKQIQKAGDEQYKRNKSMEPGDVGKGVDNDIMQKRGLSKANSMSNQSSSASGPGASASASGSASASTHNIKFADKPGQTFKAMGPDPDTSGPSGKMGAGPESYFKKGATNTAEKPSEDEIDRRMRVALGHSKGPEDYFKSTPKKDDTSGPGNSMTNQPEFLKPSAPKTSVSKADDRKPTTKSDDYETPIHPDDSQTGNKDVTRFQKGGMKKTPLTDYVSGADWEKMSKKQTNEAFISLIEKKAKKDYDGDGKVESEKDEVWGSRFKAAKKAGKMEEELKGDQKKIDANNNGKIDGDDFRKLRSGKKSEKMKAYRADRDKHGEMEEAAYPPGVSGKDTAKDKDPDMLKGSPDDEAAEKKIPTPPKKPAEMKEETFPGFSESEIAHFEAVIARKDQKGKDRGPGDVVASEDLTDEYINEMARKPGENRGVKAGVPRGPYKGKAHKGGADAKGDSMPDEGPKGVPHVLDQIRHGREDEQGFKTITHPASSPEAPVTKSIHRSELHGFYDQYHNTEKPAAKEKAYAGFLGKHFDGDTRTSAPTSQSVTTDLSKIEKSNLKGGSKVSLGGSKLVGGKK